MVVIDQLRATTTIAAALWSGVNGIHVYDSIASAREAYAACGLPGDILMGEAGALAPTGFGLGNSPQPFLQHPAEYAGRSAYMVTTNGTPALAAAGALSPAVIFTGALINCNAVARALIAGFPDQDITLLCAGLQGGLAADDLLAAGAIVTALVRASNSHTLSGDAAWMARALFCDAHTDGGLEAALRRHQGGLNLIALGLDGDITAAAALDAIDVVPSFEGGLIRRWAQHPPLA